MTVTHVVTFRLWQLKSLVDLPKISLPVLPRQSEHENRAENRAQDHEGQGDSIANEEPRCSACHEDVARNDTSHVADAYLYGAAPRSFVMTPKVVHQPYNGQRLDHVHPDRDDEQGRVLGADAESTMTMGRTLTEQDNVASRRHGAAEHNKCPAMASTVTGPCRCNRNH